MTPNIISMTLDDFMSATSEYLNVNAKTETPLFDGNKIDESRLTAWTKGKPPEPGEYNASLSRNPMLLRWWNGDHWSRCYYATDTEEFKQSRRTKRAGEGAQELMRYRGLAAPPASH